MSRPLRIYFRLAFALSWGIGGIELLTGILRHRPHPLPAANPLYFLAAYSVSLTGIALTAWYRGRGGLRRLGLRLIPWRSGALWYLIVVGGYAAITVLSMCVAALFGPTPNTLLNPAMLSTDYCLTLRVIPVQSGKNSDGVDSHSHCFWNNIRH